MSIKPYLIQPVKIYFTALLAIGLLLLTLLIGNLYHQTQTIQATLQQNMQTLAQEEIDTAIEESIIDLTSNLLELAEWDDIRQQIEDPTYYYFWHEDRLKDSPYFKKNYTELEVYDHKKWLLMPSITEKNSKTNLPLHIRHEEPMVIFSGQEKAFLHLFEPVFERDSKTIQGYIGISIELRNYLLTEHEFTHVNPESIHFVKADAVPLSDFPSTLQFEPVNNAVSDNLWQLINQFTVYIIILLIVSTILVIIIFQVLFSGPMQTLSHYVQQLKKSPKDLDQIPQETFLIKEFEELKYSIHDYHRDLQTTQNALQTQYKLVWEQARRDALTNIYNRRAFDEAWNELLATFEYNPSNITFILFDCDFFKALNDTYGHEIGDDVIRITAKTIQKTLPSDYLVYRIGGDEFAIIIQKRPLHEVFDIAKKCLKSLKNYNFSGIGIKEKIAFSVGISHLEYQNSKNLRGDLLNLPRQADIAMYKAKQSHQHKIQCYKSQLEQESLALVSNQVINTIVEAIHTGKYINMHLQAIQSVTDNSLYYESLIRVQKNNLHIYPSNIFSVVERRRLEVEMDTQIIQQILNAFKENLIPLQTGVSINISGKTLLQPHFIELFQPFLPYLKAYKIVIEIIENTLIDHMEYAKTVLNTLRQQGFLIALDDFGSGYSSIRYLAHMPVDIVKFDMSMTLALNSDEKTRNIILSTAKMVRDSGYDLVLEGVETEAMLEKAKQAGATHVQGYLFGKPKSISSFNEIKS